MELCGMPPESMIDKSRKKDYYFDTDYLYCSYGLPTWEKY